MNHDEIEAIDYRAMFLAEKRKAKKERLLLQRIKIGSGVYGVSNSCNENLSTSTTNYNSPRSDCCSSDGNVNDAIPTPTASFSAPDDASPGPKTPGANIDISSSSVNTNDNLLLNPTNSLLLHSVRKFVQEYHTSNNGANGNTDLHTKSIAAASLGGGGMQQQAKERKYPNWSKSIPLTTFQREKYQCRNSSSNSATINNANAAIPDSIYYQRNFLHGSTSDSSSTATDYESALLQWLQELPENNTNANSKATAATLNPQQRNNSNSVVAAEIAANGKWTKLQHAQRRVALFDGTIFTSTAAANCGESSQTNTASDEGTSRDDNDVVFPEPLQHLVATVSPIFSDGGYKAPNHMLINEYTAYQGIMPHTDGPSYEPCTVTISLGPNDIVLHFATNSTGSKKEIATSSSSGSDIRPNGTTEHGCSMILHGGGSLVVFEKDAYSMYQHSIRELSSSEEAMSNMTNGNTAAAVALTDTLIEFTNPLNCIHTAAAAAAAATNELHVSQPVVRHIGTKRVSITIRHKHK